MEASKSPSAIPKVSPDFGRWLEGHGLKLVSLLTGRGFVAEGFSLCAPDSTLRERAINRLESYFDLAARWGALVFIGLLRGRANVDPDAANRLVDSLQRALRDRRLRWASASSSSRRIATRQSSSPPSSRADHPQSRCGEPRHHARYLPHEYRGTLPHWRHPKPRRADLAPPSGRYRPGSARLRAHRLPGHPPHISGDRVSRLCLGGRDATPLFDFATAARQSYNHLRASWQAASSAP